MVARTAKDIPELVDVREQGLCVTVRDPELIVATASVVPGGFDGVADR